MCFHLYPHAQECKILSENMRHASAKGFINATDLADYLVKKGLPFRDAHMVSGQLVAYCIEHDTVLEKLSMEELKAIAICLKKMCTMPFRWIPA